MAGNKTLQRNCVCNVWKGKWCITHSENTSTAAFKNSHSLSAPGARSQTLSGEDSNRTHQDRVVITEPLAKLTSTSWDKCIKPARSLQAVSSGKHQAINHLPKMKLLSPPAPVWFSSFILVLGFILGVTCPYLSLIPELWRSTGWAVQALPGWVQHNSSSKIHTPQLNLISFTYRPLVTSFIQNHTH